VEAILGSDVGLDVHKTPINLEMLSNVAETMLMYLETGSPGMSLDALHKRKTKFPNVAFYASTVLSIREITQMHVLRPFGYGKGFMSVQEFSQQSVETVSSAAQRIESRDPVSEYQNTMLDIGHVLVRRGFGMKKRLTGDELSFAQMRASSSMRDPGFLDLLEKTFKEVCQPLLDQGKDMEAVMEFNALQTNCYIDAAAALKHPSMPADEEGAAVLRCLLEAIIYGFPEHIIMQKQSFEVISRRVPLDFIVKVMDSIQPSVKRSTS